MNYPIFTRGLQENWEIKADCQQNDCWSDGTTFKGLRVPKGSTTNRKTLGYMPRCHYKDLRKQPMPEYIKRLAHKKKMSVFTVSRIINKRRGKSLRRSRKSMLSAAMVSKRLETSTRLLTDLVKHRNRIYVFAMRKCLPLTLSSTNRLIGS